MAEEHTGLSDEEFEKLYDDARLALHVKRTEEALEIAQRLVGARPTSTTAHELLGDVKAALGQLEEAEQEYRLAAELEPANADAHRKLGAVVLQRKSAEFQQRMLEMQLEDRTLRGAPHPEAEGAAVRSGLFPGLGQLYNGDYEKGAALAAGGMITLGLAVNGVFGLISPETGHGREVFYLVLGGIGYLAIYVYSIWDAIRTAREHQRMRDLYRPTEKP
ncbi:MAG: tetratricopeptide repeat protein [Armatimonadetes bacterium]|nr:tetratricopeptide repeat protein [Armatimonadota bacterium]